MISAAVLQVIAMITMLVDHIGLYLLQNNSICRAVGRLAMPIFAFMIAEGCLHTKSNKKYLARILIVAIATQLLRWLFFFIKAGNISWNGAWTIISMTKLNILFNFALAISLIWFSQKFKKLTVFGIIIGAFLAETLKIEYGLPGFILVNTFYFLRKFKIHQKYKMLYCISIISVLYLCSAILAAQNHFTLQIFAFFAAVPILLYYGKLGKRLPRSLAYAFYPTHLAIIWTIDLLVG